MASAASDPITMKLDHLFAAIDTDNDGYLEWSDYQRLIDRYLSSFKIGMDDHRAQALVVAYQKHWAELVRHADGNDRLSKEQYHRAHRAASVDASHFDLVEGVPNAIFDLMDTNGDGTIAKAEFQQFVKLWNRNSQDAMNTFAQWDTDSDGVVSRHEFIRSAKEYFSSPVLEPSGSQFFSHSR